jgi:hypothetical protein
MSEFSLTEQKNEVWFECYVDTVTDDDGILGHALITVDPARGRSYSALIALLKRNGEITFLIHQLPIEHLELIVREFRQMLIAKPTTRVSEHPPAP